jgi:hypothetical protein
MENKNNLTNPIPAEPSALPKSNVGATAQYGSWVPVDPGTLGFKIDAAPGQEFIGPDGNKYCVKEAPAECATVASNRQNAIPVPSSIIQMPPIVQPIALVPYTSQNQPLLQYDPYSRPLDPQRAPKTPEYKRKPYRGLSLAALILSVAALLALLFLSVADFRTNLLRTEYRATGLDLFKALLILAGFGSGGSAYYSERIQNYLDRIPSDILSTVVVYSLPIFITVMMVVLIIMTIYYLVKLISGKTPRHFSVGALINIILSISVISVLLGMSNAEVTIPERSSNVTDFFMFRAGIATGIGLIIAFALSVVLLILPFFAKRNAYILNKEDPTLKTYIIED